MREPEIQPFITFVRRRVQIQLPILLCHSIPNFRSAFVDIHVKQLSTNKERKVVYTNPNENFVARAIHWLVVVSVDLGVG